MRNNPKEKIRRRLEIRIEQGDKWLARPAEALGQCSGFKSGPVRPPDVVELRARAGGAKVLENSRNDIRRFVCRIVKNLNPQGSGIAKGGADAEKTLGHGRFVVDGELDQKGRPRFRRRGRSGFRGSDQAALGQQPHAVDSQAGQQAETEIIGEEKEGFTEADGRSHAPSYPKRKSNRPRGA